MTTYTAWFSTDESTEFHGKQFECDPQNIPNKLASIVLPYFMDGQAQDFVKADVSAGQKWMTYLIQLQKDTLSVYRLKAKFVRRKEQEQSECSPGTAEPTAEEDDA